MFNLIFKILADATGFKRTLNTELPSEAKKAGAAAGDASSKELAAQFKAGIMRFIGAGALISFFMKAADEAARVTTEASKAKLGTEAYQELEKAVKLTGFTMEELAAKAVLAPKEFAELMKQVKDSGGILPKDTVEVLNAASNSMEKLGNGAKILLGYIVEIGAFFTTKAAAWISTGVGKGIADWGMRNGNQKATEYGVGLMRGGNLLDDMAQEHKDTVYGIPSKDAKPTAAQKFRDAAEKAQREKEGSDWWDSVGGNIDWSRKKGMDILRQEEEDRFRAEWHDMGGDLDWSKKTARGIARPMNVPAVSGGRGNSSFTTDSEALKVFREQIQATRELGKIMENKL